MARLKAKDMKNDKRYIKVTGIGPTLHKELTNIVGHIGGDVSGFVRNKLADIVHTYPAHYKKPME